MIAKKGTQSAKQNKTFQARFPDSPKDSVERSSVVQQRLTSIAFAFLNLKVVV